MMLVAEKTQAEFCSPRRRDSAGSRSERIYRFDLSLFNEIAVTEGLRIQIRAEAFNAFNSTMLSNPDSNLASIRFGLVTSAQVPPREYQMGLMILF